jgi:predicted component of type VI protein secretion system
MPRIYVLSGPDIGRTFDVQDGAKLGRAVHCEVHLRDASVSREHARLVDEGGAWRIVDTGSRNGVSVGGTRQESAALVDGVEFQVGEVLLRFRADARAAPAAVPAPAPAPSRSEERDEIVLEEDPLPAIPAPAPAPVARPAVSELERTVTSAPRPGAAVPRGRGVLQYQRIPDRPGFFASDLAQQPLWIRLGAGLLGLLLFAAIFLVAFRGTSFLKGRASGGPQPVEGEAER